MALREFFFSNKSTKQTIVKNTVWLTASTVASRGIRVLVVIFAARILGTEGYGLFSYAMSLAALWSIASDLGLSALLTREISRVVKNKSGYVATIFVLKAVILLATLVLTIATIPLTAKIDGARPLVALAALLILFDSIRSFGFSFARAQNRMEVEGIVSFITEIFVTGLSLAVLFANPSPISLSIAYIVGSAVGAVLIFSILSRDIKQYYGKFDQTLIKPILSSAAPFVLMGVFGVLMINIDTVILGFFRTAHELGLYAAAQRPVVLLYVLPALVASSIFPFMNRIAYTNENEKAKKILEISITGVLMAAIPLAIGGIILAEPLIRLFFGGNYIGAVTSFRLLLITVLFVFPGTIIGNSIFSYNMQGKLAINTSIGAGVNVVLDLLLIPTYGINGSAVATIFSQIAANGLNWRTLRERIHFTFMDKLARVFLAAAVMGACAFFLDAAGTHFFITVAVSAALYSGILFLLREPIVIQLTQGLFRVVRPNKQPNR